MFCLFLRHELKTNISNLRLTYLCSNVGSWLFNSLSKAALYDFCLRKANTFLKQVLTNPSAIIHLCVLINNILRLVHKALVAGFHKSYWGASVKLSRGGFTASSFPNVIIWDPLNTCQPRATNLVPIPPLKSYLDTLVDRTSLHDRANFVPLIYKPIK